MKDVIVDKLIIEDTDREIIAEKIISEEGSYIKVKGGIKLHGIVRPDGAKNSALIQLAATALIEDSWVTLENVPMISDVDDMIMMLGECGLIAKYNGNVVTIAGKVSSGSFSNVYGSKIRASLVFLGSILSRRGEIKLPLPGGDKIGERPIDIHIEVLNAFGIESTIKNGYIHAKAKELPLKGTTIYLKFPSVLATVNAILLATLADGKTVLMNVAKEPEIVDLTSLLIKMGANIIGVGTDKITIVGVEILNSAHHEIIPDRLETAALIMSFVMTNGNGTVDKIIPEHNEPLIQVLKSCGVNIKVEHDRIHISDSTITKGFQLETRPYPGFATDLQPIITTLAFKCPEDSMVTDTVFIERFAHVNELRKMGADIERIGNTIIIKANQKLTGATVEGNDIRTVVSLINAALGITGESKIYGISHLERGHSNFINKLKLLNADIELV